MKRNKEAKQGTPKVKPSHRESATELDSSTESFKMESVSASGTYRKSALSEKVKPVSVGADLHFKVSYSKDHTIKFIEIIWMRKRLMSAGKPNDDELRADVEAIGSYALAFAGFTTPHRIDVQTYRRTQSGTRHTMTVLAKLTEETKTDI